MNITYIIGLVFSIAVMVVGMMFQTTAEGINFVPGQIKNFFDASSVMITIGCTFGVVIASFTADMLKSVPKHFKIMMNTKRFDAMYYVEQLVELSQVARKNGLLALEEKAYQQEDPFFRQAIMLIVDANDPDKVRSILTTDVESMSSRHDSVAGMYDKASAVAPAFGMIGTLVGLINMLKNMSLDGGGANTIGGDMGTALITTLYGCILAHMVFGPIATNLRTRDEEEILCKLIIIEGIISILSGENPKFLKEKLMTFMPQDRRDEGGEGGEGEGGGKKKKEKKSKKKKGDE